MAQPQQAQPDPAQDAPQPKVGPLGIPADFDWSTFSPSRRVLGTATVSVDTTPRGARMLVINHFAGAEVLMLGLDDEEAERVAGELKPSRVARVNNGSDASGIVVP
jgi:hypothetical protein